MRRRQLENGSQQLKKEAGFTLIELLVSIALFSVVIGAAVSVFLTVVKNNNKAKITNRLRSDGSRVLDEIERDIKGADEAAVPLNTILNYRINGDEYYQYRINLDSSGNYAVQKGVSCSCNIDLSSCTDCFYTTITPTDQKNGLNVKESESGFYYKDYGEVEIILVLEDPVGLPDRSDYESVIELRSSVVLRNY